MANTYNKILLAGSQAAYDAMGTGRDANNLYFCTDSGKLYKGDVDFSSAVVVASTKPDAPVVGKIYILQDTGTVETYTGSAWQIICYSTVTVVDASSDDTHVPTAKAVHAAIEAAVAEVTGGGAVVKNVAAGSADAQFVVTKGDNSESTVTVPGVVTTPTWDATTRKLTLPVSGGAAVEVNIGKDIFLDSEADNKYNTETGNIELHLNDGTMLEIPAEALVDVYTKADTNSAKVTITDQNVISVDVVVDPVEGNMLLLTESGLKVDLSNYYTIAQTDAAVKVATDAAAAAQAKADANETAINKLNADATTEGSVDKKVKDAVDALKANEIKAASDAAAAAQSTADQGKELAESAHEALDILNGEDTVDGSVAKDIKTAVDALKAGEIKAAQDAADAAQAAAETAQGAAEAAQGTADTNAAAIEKLNGADTVEGSVDQKIKTAVDALKAAEIKNNADAAAAAQSKADANETAIAKLNAAETEEGSVAKAVKDSADALKAGEIKTAQDAADAAQSTADANTEELEAMAAGWGWGTF